MLKLLWRSLLSLVIILGLVVIRSPSAIAQPQTLELERALREIESIAEYRSKLSSNFKTDTQVCQLVAQELDRLSVENNWQVKQISSKSGNPQNAPMSDREKRAIETFHKYPEIAGFWQQQLQGIQYYQRINIEPSCLACHGAKNDRSQAIKDNYPTDLASSFKAGDLAGIYSIWIPQSKGVIQDVVPDLHFAKSLTAN